ncbi:hypothetical protein HK098_002766 [Nowakowskiella sp. JEL0407]|nr:hypothetical protein HK098_002766 [Nowakowskiella sp. JEL0407]
MDNLVNKFCSLSQLPDCEARYIRNKEFLSDIFDCWTKSDSESCTQAVRTGISLGIIKDQSLLQLPSIAASSEGSENCDSNHCYKWWHAILISIISAELFIYVALILLTLIGFGASGPIAGTFAAYFQGPQIVAGSLFAFLQKMAMTAWWRLPTKGLLALLLYAVAFRCGCSGSYGTVKEAINIETGQKVAIKFILKKSLANQQETEMVIREMKILSGIKHPNIIQMIDAFETKHKYYMVFELATGGELFERLAVRGNFTEKDAANIIYVILDAVELLHSKGIVHRDIKPENILYKTKSDYSPIMIADFGVSNYVHGDDLLKSLAGSPGYAAPEVMRRVGHGKPADIWSIGCLAYTILCGYHPFYHCDDMPSLLEAVSKGRWKFEEPYWKSISQYAKSFIQLCLTLNPKSRPTAAQAKLNPWLVKYSAAAKENAREYIKTRPKTHVQEKPPKPLPQPPLEPADSHDTIIIQQCIDYHFDGIPMPNLAEEVWTLAPVDGPDAESLAIINDYLASGEPSTLPVPPSSSSSAPIKRKITFSQAAKAVTAVKKFEKQLSNAKLGLIAMGIKVAANNVRQNQNQAEYSSAASSDDGDD